MRRTPKPTKAFLIRRMSNCLINARVIQEALAEYPALTTDTIRREEDMLTSCRQIEAIAKVCLERNE